MRKVTVAAALAVTLIFSGCAATPKPVETSESLDSDPIVAVIEPKSYGFGDARTYPDGVVISVEPGIPFMPTYHDAPGTVAGLDHYAFRITIHNGSDDILEPVPYVSLVSAGIEQRFIIDSANELGKIGGDTPYEEMQPGESVSWYEAYSVSDLNDILVTVTPSYKYEDTNFTN